MNKDVDLISVQDKIEYLQAFDHWSDPAGDMDPGGLVAYCNTIIIDRDINPLDIIAWVRSRDGKSLVGPDEVVEDAIIVEDDAEPKPSQKLSNMIGKFLDRIKSGSRELVEDGIELKVAQSNLLWGVEDTLDEIFTSKYGDLIPEDIDLTIDFNVELGPRTMGEMVTLLAERYLITDMITVSDNSINATKIRPECEDPNELTVTVILKTE